MAKPRPKTKKKTQKKRIDPLAVSLRLLAHADRECIRAIRYLCKAVLSPVQEPEVVSCEFRVHKKKYRATVTADQCEKILKAVGENGDVLDVVKLLLSDLTKLVADDMDRFATTLGITAKVRKTLGVVPSPSLKPVPLGCCIYSGGRTPNLTQSQCNQFHPIKWSSSDPECLNS